MTDPSIPRGAETRSDDPALRDAASVAERIAADEAAAVAARDEYRVKGLPTLPREAVGIELSPGELVHVHRPAALAERSPAAGVGTGPSSGPLWITAQRLIHAGSTVTSVELREIDEMAVAVGQLLLIRLRDGSALAIEVDGPRLLRVQLAAAIEAVRRR